MEGAGCRLVLVTSHPPRTKMRFNKTTSTSQAWARGVGRNKSHCHRDHRSSPAPSFYNCGPSPPFLTNPPPQPYIHIHAHNMYTHIYTYIYIYLLCVYVLSHVQLFATLWTIAHQAPLSMEFPRQEY